MKRFRTIVTALFLMGIILSARVSAQDTSPKDPHSGDLWNRSTLTGDWSGLRNEWAQKGITFDFNITQVGQGYINIDSPRSEEGRELKPETRNHSLLQDFRLLV